jgi:hypothetical protein
MSAIKDVIDLTTQLSKSVTDRKLATELLQILTLISVVQTESNDMMSKNLDLERNIFNLEKQHEKEISELKEKLSAKELVSKYDFNKTIGVYVSKEDEQYYCTSCLLKGIESPLHESSSGWHCKLGSCEQHYYSSRNIDPPPTPGYSWQG